MTRTARTKSDLLVALHGLPRVGKDTLANALVEKHNFFKAAFADALYEEVASSFGVWIGELRSDSWKTIPQPMLAIRCSDCPKFRAAMQSMGEDLLIPRTSRYILRKWAHEYRRQQNQEYWVNELSQSLSVALGNLVVTDLRYAHDEYPYLVKFAKATARKLVVVEVQRQLAYGEELHASDMRLHGSLIDMTVVNVSGHPDKMIDSVFQFLDLGE